MRDCPLLRFPDISLGYHEAFFWQEIREGGLRRMLCQATLWMGRWKVKCSLLLHVQRLGGNLVGSNHVYLHVELVPHGNLSPWVSQHFFPVVPLRSCDVQAQAALAEHMALPSSILAQHFQLHTGGTQQLMRHLKHDHLVPDRVDLVFCTFGLLLLQLQGLMPQCHLDRNIYRRSRERSCNRMNTREI